MNPISVHSIHRPNRNKRRRRNKRADQGGRTSDEQISEEQYDHQYKKIEQPTDNDMLGRYPSSGSSRSDGEKHEAIEIPNFQLTNRIWETYPTPSSDDAFPIKPGELHAHQDPDIQINISSDRVIIDPGAHVDVQTINNINSILPSDYPIHNSTESQSYQPQTFDTAGNVIGTYENILDGNIAITQPPESIHIIEEYIPINLPCSGELYTPVYCVHVTDRCGVDDDAVANESGGDPSKLHQKEMTCMITEYHDYGRSENKMKSDKHTLNIQSEKDDKDSQQHISNQPDREQCQQNNSNDYANIKQDEQGYMNIQHRKRKKWQWKWPKGKLKLGQEHIQQKQISSTETTPKHQDEPATIWADVTPSSRQTSETKTYNGRTKQIDITMPVNVPKKKSGLRLGSCSGKKSGRRPKKADLKIGAEVPMDPVPAVDASADVQVSDVNVAVDTDVGAGASGTRRGWHWPWTRKGVKPAVSISPGTAHAAVDIAAPDASLDITGPRLQTELPEVDLATGGNMDAQASLDVTAANVDAQLTGELPYTAMTLPKAEVDLELPTASAAAEGDLGLAAVGMEASPEVDVGLSLGAAAVPAVGVDLGSADVDVVVGTPGVSVKKPKLHFKSGKKQKVAKLDVPSVALPAASASGELDVSGVSTRVVVPTVEVGESVEVAAPSGEVSMPVSVPKKKSGLRLGSCSGRKSGRRPKKADLEIGAEVPTDQVPAVDASADVQVSDVSVALDFVESPTCSSINCHPSASGHHQESLVVSEIISQRSFPPCVESLAPSRSKLSSSVDACRIGVELFDEDLSLLMSDVTLITEACDISRQDPPTSPYEEFPVDISKFPCSSKNVVSAADYIPYRYDNLFTDSDLELLLSDHGDMSISVGSLQHEHVGVINPKPTTAVSAPITIKPFDIISSDLDGHTSHANISPKSSPSKFWSLRSNIPRSPKRGKLLDEVHTNRADEKDAHQDKIFKTRVNIDLPDAIEKPRHVCSVNDNGEDLIDIQIPVKADLKSRYTFDIMSLFSHKHQRKEDFHTNVDSHTDENNENLTVPRMTKKKRKKLNVHKIRPADLDGYTKENVFNELTNICDTPSTPRSPSARAKNSHIRQTWHGDNGHILNFEELEYGQQPPPLPPTPTCIRIRPVLNEYTNLVHARKRSSNISAKRRPWSTLEFPPAGCVFVNDDYLFPDAFTPTKLPSFRSSKTAVYDLPYMDDKAIPFEEPEWPIGESRRTLLSQLSQKSDSPMRVATGEESSLLSLDDKENDDRSAERRFLLDRLFGKQKRSRRRTEKQDNVDESNRSPSSSGRFTLRRNKS